MSLAQSDVTARKDKKPNEKLHSETIKGDIPGRQNDSCDSEHPGRNCQRAYRCQTEHIAKARAGEMIGFAIVAWGVSGGVSTSLSCFDGSQVGTMMAPEFVKTALVDFIASGD